MYNTFAKTKQGTFISSSGKGSSLLANKGIASKQGEESYVNYMTFPANMEFIFQIVHNLFL